MYASRTSHCQLFNVSSSAGADMRFFPWTHGKYVGVATVLCKSMTSLQILVNVSELASPQY